MQVVAQAGPGKDDGPYDPRVTITTVRALLPHGFAIESLRGEINGLDLAIAEETDPADFVVHLPRPDALSTDAAHRASLLRDVDHMILVGSPRRARRIAEM